MNSRHRDHEIVMLDLNWNKAETVPTNYSLDGQAPVSATLRYCHGDGVMGVGLRPIASRPLTASKRSIKIRVPLPALRLTSCSRCSRALPQRRPLRRVRRTGDPLVGRQFLAGDGNRERAPSALSEMVCCTHWWPDP
jgi:hypothetical protein